MDNGLPSSRSHLFAVRLWKEELGDGQTEYRGRVQHLASGGTRHFRDWPTLVALLQEKLRELDRENDIQVE